MPVHSTHSVPNTYCYSFYCRCYLTGRITLGLVEGVIFAISLEKGILGHGHSRSCVTLPQRVGTGASETGCKAPREAGEKGSADEAEQWPGCLAVDGVSAFEVLNIGREEIRAFA